MNAEQFAYWLQGFTELNPSVEQPTPEQWKSITEHLKTVFVKVTPPFRVFGPVLAEPARQPAHEEIFRVLSKEWPHHQLLVTC